jgi:hypothetical protein
MISQKRFSTQADVQVEPVPIVASLTRLCELATPFVDLDLGQIAHLRDEFSAKLRCELAVQRLMIVSVDERQHPQRDVGEACLGK